MREHLDLVSSVIKDFFKAFTINHPIHLEILIKIKGYSREERKKEIVEVSTFVGLQNDLGKKASQLSGGMKRRLSVAMALTGGSKVIILDEPTSGLDFEYKYLKFLLLDIF